MFIHVFPDDIDHYLGGEIGRYPELLLDTKTLVSTDHDGHLPSQLGTSF